MPRIRAAAMRGSSPVIRRAKMSSTVNPDDRALVRERFGAHSSAALRGIADRIVELSESRKAWFRQIAAELDRRGIATLNDASDEIVDAITKRRT
jgi:hypothetical protein